MHNLSLLWHVLQMCLVPDEAQRLLTLLLTLPHGVLKNSHTVPGETGRLPGKHVQLIEEPSLLPHRRSCHCLISGLVESSTNLASVQPGPVEGSSVLYRVQCSTRSSLMHALERCRGAIRQIAGLCGAAVEQDQAYPGWLPQPDAKVVRLAQAAIGEVIGRVPELKAIHAGLE